MANKELIMLEVCVCLSLCILYLQSTLRFCPNKAAASVIVKSLVLN